MNNTQTTLVHWETNWLEACHEGCKIVSPTVPLLVVRAAVAIKWTWDNLTFTRVETQTHSGRGQFSSNPPQSWEAGHLLKFVRSSKPSSTLLCLSSNQKILQLLNDLNYCIQFAFLSRCKRLQFAHVCGTSVKFDSLLVYLSINNIKCSVSASYAHAQHSNEQNSTTLAPTSASCTSSAQHPSIKMRVL